MTLLSESFAGSSAKGSRGYCILSAAHESLPLTASALQIFIDIIMPPLAIIYPSSNSTSLSILPHKSTPPAPVIISLLLSEFEMERRKLALSTGKPWGTWFIICRWGLLRVPRDFFLPSRSTRQYFSQESLRLTLLGKPRCCSKGLLSSSFTSSNLKL